MLDLKLVDRRGRELWFRKKIYKKIVFEVLGFLVFFGGEVCGGDLIVFLLVKVLLIYCLLSFKIVMGVFEIVLGFRF